MKNVQNGNRHTHTYTQKYANYDVIRETRFTGGTAARVKPRKRRKLKKKNKVECCHGDRIHEFMFHDLSSSVCTVVIFTELHLSLLSILFLTLPRIFVGSALCYIVYCFLLFSYTFFVRDIKYVLYVLCSLLCSLRPALSPIDRLPYRRFKSIDALRSSSTSGNRRLA